MEQEVYFGEIQHGHMEQVGYDTYCRLLDEVMKEMQGIEIEEEQEIQIDLNVSSYIPDEYIKEARQKIKVYQDIALCRKEEDIQNVIDEVIDIYGEMPEELQNLIEIARIKELCKKAYVTKVAQKMSGVVFTFTPTNFKMEIVDMLIKKYRNKIKFSPGSQPYITYKIEALSDIKILTQIQDFLKDVIEI